MSHTLAICFTNFGPYHIARLEALGTALAEQGGHLLAYEMAGTEEKDPWSITGPGLSDHVRHFRLFPGRSLESLTARECRQAIASRLDQDQPTAIAAVGYVRPESLEMRNRTKHLGCCSQRVRGLTIRELGGKRRSRAAAFASFKRAWWVGKRIGIIW